MTTRDRVVPALAFAAVAAVAAIVVALLSTATSDGSQALKDAKEAQVRSTASSFSARLESTFTAVAGLGAQPWELKRDSAADEATLRAYNFDTEAVSGYFLVDGRDTISAGVLLRPGELGSTYDPPEWAGVKEALASVPAVVLPVQQSGITTELPSYAFVVAIRGEDPTSVRGMFVFEQALTSDSSFNLEIQGLVADESSTAAWRFVDSNGAVLATTLPTGLGELAADREVQEITDGLRVVDGDLIISAAVPAVGWRVVFTQDEAEFVEPLAGPLQTAGLTLVLLLLAIGLGMTVVLAKRLRQAREEEARLLALHRAQEEFISVVSHELRTPVSGVLGFLQTTLDHWETMRDEDRHDAVRRAYANARRLQATARDVLDTEGIEAGEFGYVKHPIDVADEVRTSVESFASSNTALTLTLPAEPAIVNGDPDRIQQVLANLLENALKFASTDAPVEVSVARTGEVVRIAVSDRGVGIEADQIDRIFDKFVRTREGTVTGTGLGLYIARRIVEAHEGRIWATSVPGGWTTFIVELPAASPTDG